MKKNKTNKEWKERLERFADDIWGTSDFAETPFNDYTREKRENDYERIVDEMIQEIESEKQKNYQSGFKNGQKNVLEEFKKYKQEYLHNIEQ